jgi:predicted lipoprotein with Yx(FWY)xxD motif
MALDLETLLSHEAGQAIAASFLGHPVTGIGLSCWDDDDWAGQALVKPDQSRPEEAARIHLAGLVAEKKYAGLIADDFHGDRESASACLGGDQTSLAREEAAAEALVDEHWAEIERLRDGVAQWARVNVPLGDGRMTKFDGPAFDSLFPSTP